VGFEAAMKAEMERDGGKRKNLQIETSLSGEEEEEDEFEDFRRYRKGNPY